MKVLLPALLMLPLLAFVTSVSPPQEVPNGELQRFIYMGNYPTWCGEAQVLTRRMRVNPSTDPAFLREVMVATIQNCANTNHALQNAPLWNQAVFAGAAAALLAARHQSLSGALRDATYAKDWSAEIINFVHRPGPGRPGSGRNIPSQFRTDAGRINRDADTLIAAIHAASRSTQPAPDSLPNEIPVPHPTPGH